MEIEDKKEPPQELTSTEAKINNEVRLDDVCCPTCNAHLLVYTNLDKLVAAHGAKLEELLGLRS